MRRRAGTHSQVNKMDPGSAAHHAAKGGALRSIRGTPMRCTGFRFAFRQASLSGKEAVKNEFRGDATV
jgi:hypothetical protein